MVMSDNHKSDSFLKNNKKIIVVLLSIILILVILTIGFLMISSEPEDIILSGYVFINNDVAPEGVNVSIDFNSTILYDSNGTDSKGRYFIDVTEFDGETGKLYIKYNGISYEANDHNGNQQIVKVNHNTLKTVNIYLNLNDNDIDDGPPENNDDSSDNDNTDDDYEQDEEDDTNDDTTDDTDETDDSTDDETDPDSDSSGDQDDESEPEIIISLETTKSIWDQAGQNWDQTVSIDFNEAIQYNISVVNDGNVNLSSITIKDELHKQLVIVGDCRVNNEIIQPEIDQQNHIYYWNITELNVNQKIQINYNCTAKQRGQFKNNVSVNATYNNTITYSNSTATVKIIGDISIEKNVWDRESEQWMNHTKVQVNDSIRYNLTIRYNGSFLLDNLDIIDYFTQGLVFNGNATANGITYSPVIDNANKQLKWNNMHLDDNDIIFIEYDMIITRNTTEINQANVSCSESTGVILIDSDNASVKAFEPKEIECDKTVRFEQEEWVESVDVEVGDTIQFNITITNNGDSIIYNLNIIDQLPTNMVYVQDSCVIKYKNLSFKRRPSVNETNNLLYWTNLNQLIQDYLKPDHRIFILFNATITGVGNTRNNASISSTECEGCEFLTDYDYAYANATMPIEELQIVINGPYTGFIDETIRISAQATGGITPYNYTWDMDNDGIFDDENRASFYYQWDEPGVYYIHARVEDSRNITKTTGTTVNITIEPLEADAGGPYNGYENLSIKFNGYAAGGRGNYTWQWDFGDGNTSSIKNPSHIYEKQGIYTLKLTVTDETNTSVNDTTTVTILPEDNQGPVILIEKPINAIYIRNRAILPFRNPIIFGEIEIEFSSTDNQSDIAYMQLYIDDTLVKTISDSYGNYTWNERLFKRTTLKIIAYDTLGNDNEIETNVLKLF